MNEALLSDREQRMQKTYSELFKLQNLLEKTVRNVQVSNNFKSAGSAEPSSSMHAKENVAHGGGGGGGRPYYPGSPVKGKVSLCGWCFDFELNR